MSWEQARRRMLQPVWDEAAKVTRVPHMTSPPGLRWREDLGKLEDHPGADLNYEGGQALPLNRSHPAIRSPVTGIVTRAGEGDYGTIAIQDENGLSHQILHTHSRHVAVGDPVVAGQLIGTMGNTGVNRRGVEGGDFHVHYQIKNRDGNIVNPVEYWDQQGPIDPNPPTPSYLNEYLQYQRSLGATVDNAFGNTPDAGPRYAPQPIGMTGANPTLPGRGEPQPARSDVRVLRSRIASPPTASGLRINPVGPLPNEQPPADRAASFNDRFGNWASSAGASAPLSPYQQFSPPPQTAKPLGIVSGEPMPDYPFPPPIFGVATPGLEDWAGPQRRRANWDKGG